MKNTPRVRATALLLATLFCLTSCASEAERRKATIQRANEFLALTWTPTEKNIRHGADRYGVHVDTPDDAYENARGRGYGWRVGEANRGMPYKWGGFDTPESFLLKIKHGHPAGDRYSAAKREQLEKAVSREAAGIDCSGFISRCWNLSRHYSTRELPGLCRPLESFAELKAGDLLNKHNDHALLFHRWDAPDKSAFLAFEAGAPPFQKAQMNRYFVSRLKEKGFQPYTYLGR
ncbi:MAG: hypothetical protein ACQKBY_00335 [Verrucomicrobiales bacterium]